MSDGHGMLLWRKRQITVGLAQQWKMLAPVHHVEACRQAGLAYQAAGQRSRPVHDKRKDGVQAQRCGSRGGRQGSRMVGLSGSSPIGQNLRHAWCAPSSSAGACRGVDPNAHCKESL